MNQTALLHIAGTASLGAAIIVSDLLLTAGLVGLGASLFVAGIVVARRGDD